MILHEIPLKPRRFLTGTAGVLFLLTLGILCAEGRLKGHMSYQGQVQQSSNPNLNPNRSPAQFSVQDFMMPGFPFPGIGGFDPFSAVAGAGGPNFRSFPMSMSFIPFAKMAAPAPNPAAAPPTVDQKMRVLDWPHEEAGAGAGTGEDGATEKKKEPSKVPVSVPELLFPEENQKITANNWIEANVNGNGNGQSGAVQEENEIKVDGKIDPQTKEVVVEEVKKPAVEVEGPSEGLHQVTEVEPKPKETVPIKSADDLNLNKIVEEPKTKVLNLKKSGEGEQKLEDGDSKPKPKPKQMDFTIEFDMEMPIPGEGLVKSSKPMDLVKVDPTTSTTTTPLSLPTNPTTPNPSGSKNQQNQGQSRKILLPSLFDLIFPLHKKLQSSNNLHRRFHGNNLNGQGKSTRKSQSKEGGFPILFPKASNLIRQDRCDGVHCTPPPQMEGNCVMQKLPINIKSPVGRREEWSAFSNVTDCCPLWLCSRPDGSFNIHYGLVGSSKRHDQILDKIVSEEMGVKEDEETGEVFTKPTPAPSVTTYKEIRTSLKHPGTGMKEPRSPISSLIEFLAKLPMPRPSGSGRTSVSSFIIPMPMMRSKKLFQVQNGPETDKTEIVKSPRHFPSFFLDDAENKDQDDGPKNSQPHNTHTFSSDTEAETDNENQDNTLNDLFPVKFMSKARLPHPLTPNVFRSSYSHSSHSSSSSNNDDNNNNHHPMQFPSRSIIAISTRRSPNSVNPFSFPDFSFSPKSDQGQSPFGNSRFIHF